MSFLDSADDDPSADPRRAARRPMLLFILVTLAVGAFASVFTEPSIPTWYAGLIHPSFAPPNWLFAPVWTALYILMAVAAWRAWRVRGLKSPALIAYGLQLFLNFCWSAIFFSLHRMGAALIEIGTLWLALLVTTILFFRADKLSGLMLLPYLAWTAFAVALNYAFWALNG